MKKLLILTLSLFTFGFGHTQIDGDNIFAKDQVIKIELQFDQTNYWDSLINNYETSTYMIADLIITDSTGVTSFDSVGVRLKGNSTFNHPNNKKAFKIDFNKYISGQDYDGLKKLNFSNGFKDPSLMREKIFFDLCREVGTPAPRANFANVYFNGELKGFYTVIEQIDDQFLDWKILDDDGNLFKAGDNFMQGPPGAGGSGTPADLVYYGDNQTAYNERYELKTNEEENNWTDLIEFIDFINNSSDSDFENQLPNKIALSEYIRSVALDNLFSNLDSYTGSARNYYLYHNLTTDKWQWIKWDANETFGSYAQGVDVLNMAIDYHENDRPLLDRLFNTETFFNQYKQELCWLTDKYFNNTYLNAKIDAYKTLIQASVYADNNKQYTNAQFDQIIESNINTGGGGPGGGGPGGGTTYGLKPFIESRNTFVKEKIDCSAYLSIPESLDQGTLIYPNPASKTLNISTTNNNLYLAKIYNTKGKLVLESRKQDIDISVLPKGIYHVKIETTSKQITTKKLVVL